VAKLKAGGAESPLCLYVCMPCEMRTLPL